MRLRGCYVYRAIGRFVFQSCFINGTISRVFFCNKQDMEREVVVSIIIYPILVLRCGVRCGEI